MQGWCGGAHDAGWPLGPVPPQENQKWTRAKGKLQSARMFKSNPFASLLVMVLFFLALVACWSSVRFYFSVKELHSLQARFQNLSLKLNAVQSLVNESIAYSKQDPSIDALLLEFKLKVKAPGGTATPPAAARPTR